MPWRNYSAGDAARIAEPPTFLDDQSERPCPTCGLVALRQYVYRSQRRESAGVVGYAWCRFCQRYTGSTGPVPARLSLNDPLEGLSAGERAGMEEDLGLFFARLDGFWDEGLLPQQIASR
jgi:hypothetical protein